MILPVFIIYSKTSVKYEFFYMIHHIFVFKDFTKLLSAFKTFKSNRSDLPLASEFYVPHVTRVIFFLLYQELFEFLVSFYFVFYHGKVILLVQVMYKALYFYKI